MAGPLKPKKLPAAPTPDLLRFGRCEIDRRTCQLWRDGKKQPVRRLVFDVLMLLIEHRPNVLTHAQIGAAIWGRGQVPPAYVRRPVMEARQAIGDGTEPAIHIVSVRGVGYRFASEVGTARSQSPHLANAVDFAGIQDEIERAEWLLLRSNYAEARYHADRAIAMADAAGAHQEQARTLSLASTIALHTSSLERAAALAQEALTFAELDGRAPGIAQARLAMAQIHLNCGSLHAALDAFQAAYKLLQTREASNELVRCELMLCRVYCDLDQYDEAQSWCQRAQSTAAQLDPQGRAIRERLYGVAVTLSRMETAAQEDSDHPAVYESAQSALNTLDLILPDAQAVEAAVHVATCISYRAHALFRLRRFEEAWAMHDQLQSLLAGAAPEAMAWVDHRELERHSLLAHLLGHANRIDEALEAIDTALLLAPRLDPHSKAVADLQGQAAVLCERAGRMTDALTWLRHRHHSVSALQSTRAQQTASIMRVQLQSEHLQHKLVQATEQTQSLELENQSLRRRLELLERLPLTDAAGLLRRDVLDEMLAGHIADAQRNDLPMCIGLVRLNNHRELARGHCKESGLRMVRLLAAAMRNAFGESAPIAQRRPGIFYFHMGSLGPKARDERCASLSRKLNSFDWPLWATEFRPDFSTAAVDAARYDSLASALKAAVFR